MTTRSDPKRSDRSRWLAACDPTRSAVRKKKKTVIPGSFHDGHRASIASSRVHASTLDPRAVSSHAPNPGKPTFPSLGFGRTRGGSSYGCRDRSPLTMSTRRADR
jgi:hypothetical protein